MIELQIFSNLACRKNASGEPIPSGADLDIKVEVLALLPDRCMLLISFLPKQLNEEETNLSSISSFLDNNREIFFSRLI